MEHLPTIKTWDALAKQWQSFRKFIGRNFWVGLVALCLIAALFGYRVTFSPTDGFQFEPASSIEASE